MADHLVILAHADPSVGDKYTNALAAKVGEPTEFVFANAFQWGGFSSAYRKLASAVRDRSGRLLPGLGTYCKTSKPIDAYRSVTAASFSAGYALWREVLGNAQDAAQIDALVSLDSWHAGFDADGTARDSQLGGIVAHALRAKEGHQLCVMGHTDVPTPQPGQPNAFASTTQTADEVRRLAGGEGGGFRIESFNLSADPKTEHMLALTQWGHGMLADTVAQLVAGLPDDEPAPADLPLVCLGLRALDIAADEQKAGVKEIPGPKHNKRILEYFAGCMRNGQNIGAALQADEYAWCAAAASWCAYRAAVAGELIPHKWRAAVRELWADALASGYARSKAQILSGAYQPQVGDLAIMTRGGVAFGSGANAFAKTNGKGHVGRITEWTDLYSYETKDGNVNNTWTDVHRNGTADSFVGVIAYPRIEIVPEVPSDPELEVMDRLNRLYLDIAASKITGMDVVDALNQEAGRLDV